MCFAADNLQDIYIYIYAFSRRFYPKRLTLHSSYSFFYILFEIIKDKRKQCRVVIIGLYDVRDAENTDGISHKN